MANKKSLDEWLHELETKHNKKIDLGLERVNSVYKNLNLAKVAPVIITVAGTNGKGSTVAMLSSICQKANYKVGEFTSPHILKYNERIKINSQSVSDELITNAFELIDQNLGGTTLSYFEYSTLAAVIIFKQENVDVAMLEVGLGGRLDSTNMIDADCAVITTISIDHTHWLGDTVELIAYEKAGIMRKNKPVIYGDENCPLSIVEYAQSIKANLLLTEDEILTEQFELNLAGEYQQKNAKTAVAAIQALKGLLSISKQNIEQGLSEVKLLGRLEVISKHPEIILDVSHNEQAAKSLSIWLKNNPIKGKTIAVFAVLADKTAVNWLKYFKHEIDLWCVSQVQNSRAMPVTELIAELANIADLIVSFVTINEAMIKAQIISNDHDRIVVFGSFYTVSDALESFNKNP